MRPLGVVLRLRTILTSIAGRVYLMQDGMDDPATGLRWAQSLLKRLLWGTPWCRCAPCSPFLPMTDRKLAEAGCCRLDGDSLQAGEATMRAQFGLTPGASTVLLSIPAHRPASRSGSGRYDLGAPRCSLHRAATDPQIGHDCPDWHADPSQVLRGEQQHRRPPLRHSAIPSNGRPCLAHPRSAVMCSRSCTYTLSRRAAVELTRGGPYLLFLGDLVCALQGILARGGCVRT